MARFLVYVNVVLSVEAEDEREAMDIAERCLTPPFQECEGVEFIEATANYAEKEGG